MATINFEQVNPRAHSFSSPLKASDPEFAEAYVKLVKSTRFPAGFENGLYNTMIGVVICITGLVCLAAGIDSELRLVSIGLGFVLGVLVAIVFGRFLQARFLFPRGGATVISPAKPKPVMVALPALLCVAVPAYFVLTHYNHAFLFSLGGVMALIELFAFAKTGRNVLLVTAFLLFIVPYIVAQMIGMSSDLIANIIVVIPYEGLVFVCTGVFLTQKAVSVVPRIYDRDHVRILLASDSPSRKFLGLTYLSANLDSDMIPDLAVCMQDENYVIAYTAQVAFGNLWGPKPHELCMPLDYGIPDNAPEEYRNKMLDKYRASRTRSLDSWTRHHTLVEEKAAEVGAGDEHVAECLYALAEGKNVKHMSARITAIEMLGCMRTPRAYATLMTLLQHTSKPIARAAIASFFGADSKAILYLEKFFVAQTAWLRTRAIRATRSLLDYLAIFDQEEHSVACALLDPDIDGLLDSEDTPTFAAAITLLPSESKADVEILEEYAANDRPIIRIAALSSITRHCPDIALRYAESALEDSSAAVRYAAVLCIEDLLPSGMEQILLRMAEDPSQRVAACARRALTRLRGHLKSKGYNL